MLHSSTKYRRASAAKCDAVNFGTRVLGFKQRIQSLLDVVMLGEVIDEMQHRVGRDLDLLCFDQAVQLLDLAISAVWDQESNEGTMEDPLLSSVAFRELEEGLSKQLKPRGFAVVFAHTVMLCEQIQTVFDPVDWRVEWSMSGQEEVDQGVLLVAQKPQSDLGPDLTANLATLSCKSFDSKLVVAGAHLAKKLVNPLRDFDAECQRLLLSEVVVCLCRIVVTLQAVKPCVPGG